MTVASGTEYRVIHTVFSQAPASPGASLQPMTRHAVAGCPRPPEGVEGLSAPHEERQPPQLTLRDMQVFARLLVAAQGRALALEAQTCETGDCQYGVISPPYRRACTVALVLLRGRRLPRVTFCEDLTQTPATAQLYIYQTRPP